MRQLNLGNSASQAVTEAVRETPVSNAASSLESNFKTPLAIALTSGALAIAVGSFVFDFYFKDTLGIATLTTVSMWFWQVKDDRFLKRTFERLVGRDIDGDGYIGEPPEPQENLRVTVTEKRRTGSWTGYFESPITEPVLGQYARAVRSGRETGYRHWAGKGKPFVSRKEYEDFREELMCQGLAKWKDENARTQGFKLTARGTAVFKELSKIPATTPPELQQ